MLFFFLNIYFFKIMELKCWRDKSLIEVTIWVVDREGTFFLSFSLFLYLLWIISFVIITLHLQKYLSLFLHYAPTQMRCADGLINITILDISSKIFFIIQIQHYPSTELFPPFDVRYCGYNLMLNPTIIFQFTICSSADFYRS